jgi:hypothetical protein
MTLRKYCLTRKAHAPAGRCSANRGRLVSARGVCFAARTGPPLATTNRHLEAGQRSGNIQQRTAWCESCVLLGAPTQQLQMQTGSQSTCSDVPNLGYRHVSQGGRSGQGLSNDNLALALNIQDALSILCALPTFVAELPLDRVLCCAFECH